MIQRWVGGWVSQGGNRVGPGAPFVITQCSLSWGNANMTWKGCGTVSRMHLRVICVHCNLLHTTQDF